MVAPVRADLVAHLAFELIDRPRRPAAPLAGRGEQGGDGQQADDVGQVVVAADLPPLQVRADEAPVCQQRCGDLVEPGRPLLQQRQRAQPVGGADRDVHRARPVGAALDRVGGDPVAQLGAELVDVAGVPGQAMRRRQQRQVLRARQLPRDLDVRPVAADDRQAADVLERPGRAGLEVTVPGDPVPKFVGPKPSRSKRWATIASARARIASRSASRSPSHATTVGIAARTGPRMAANASTPPRARASARLETRGGATRMRMRCSGRAHDRGAGAQRGGRAPPRGPRRRQAAYPTRSRRSTFRRRARARPPSGRTRRSRCRGSRAGSSTPGPRDAPPRARRRGRSRSARARPMRTRGSRAGPSRPGWRGTTPRPARRSPACAAIRGRY